MGSKYNFYVCPHGSQEVTGSSVLCSHWESSVLCYVGSQNGGIAASFYSRHCCCKLQILPHTDYVGEGEK